MKSILLFTRVIVCALALQSITSVNADCSITNSFRRIASTAAQSSGASLSYVARRVYKTFLSFFTQSSNSSASEIKSNKKANNSSKKDAGQSYEGSHTCCICQEDFTSGDTVCVLNKDNGGCKCTDFQNAYHENCMNEILKRPPCKCPMCRTLITSNPLKIAYKAINSDAPAKKESSCGQTRIKNEKKPIIVVKQEKEDNEADLLYKIKQDIKRYEDHAWFCQLLPQEKKQKLICEIKKTQGLLDMLIDNYIDNSTHSRQNTSTLEQYFNLREKIRILLKNKLNKKEVKPFPAYRIGLDIHAYQAFFQKELDKNKTRKAKKQCLNFTLSKKVQTASMQLLYAVEKHPCRLCNKIFKTHEKVVQIDSNNCRCFEKNSSYDVYHQSCFKKACNLNEGTCPSCREQKVHGNIAVFTLVDTQRIAQQKLSIQRKTKQALNIQLKRVLKQLQDAQILRSMVKKQKSIQALSSMLTNQENAIIKLGKKLLKERSILQKQILMAHQSDLSSVKNTLLQQNNELNKQRRILNDWHKVIKQQNDHIYNFDPMDED